MSFCRLNSGDHVARRPVVLIKGEYVMRVAIAGLVLESVSFLPSLTEIEDFRRSECVGDDIIARYRGTNTTMGGFIKGLSDAGVDIVPVLIAGGWAAGPASDAAFVHY